MTNPKKRRLISYEKLPIEVKKIFREKYPMGIDDVDDDDILKVDTPKGETFKAVRLETDDAIFLIKVKTIEKSFIIDEEDDIPVIASPEIPPIAELDIKEAEDDGEHNTEN